MPLRITLLAVLTLPALGLAIQRANPPRSVVELIEDDSHDLITKLNNDGGLDATKIHQEFRDVYSGVSSVRVTPFQRFSANIQGWNYPIVENPQPGQFRYIRFAWKRLAKPGEQVGIMIQLHSNASWNHRYYAGRRSDQTATWGPMLQVDPKAPTEWTVVTRDLFKDFGEKTLTGFALTPMENGVAGLFDHVYLGRSIEALDRASAHAFGKTPLAKPLTLLELGNLWEDLAKSDVKITSPAVRKLIQGRQESVPYLAKMLRVKPAKIDTAQIARWIDDLDHDIFQVREKAYRALDQLGGDAVRPLQAAREKTRSLEQRNRIDDLLKKLGIVEGELSSEQLRHIRAIRVLEWSGMPEAAVALDALAKDPPEPLILADIRQARARMKR